MSGLKKTHANFRARRFSDCDVPSTILDTQPQHLPDSSISLGSMPSVESTAFQSNSFSNLWMQTGQDSVAHSRGNSLHKNDV